MKLTNLMIRDLITSKAELTFLVGAGCSVDPPSCLPAGRAMMDALIDYTCAESEIEKIKKLKELRFEKLVEILSERLDPQLKVIDFYGLCDTPNLQHFFLAEMMRQGQFILTTNFDFLIEYALEQSGIPKNEIIPVITKEDYHKYSNPKKLFKNGKKPLYKIHGSTKNVITGDPTRDSLIATIQAFGANKEGENVFQLESFKQPAFINLTKGRSLVVIGYSGSDDFDIIPTLKVLKNIQDIIWINYIHGDEGKDLIYEIEVENIENSEILAKIDQILVDIKRMNYAKRVLRVDVNTTRMVKDLIPAKTKINSDIFSINAYEWLSNNIEHPTILTKLSIAYKIYHDFDRYTDAMSILEEIVSIAENEEEKGWKAFALDSMGVIYMAQGNYPEALKRYEESLQIDEQLGRLSGKATVLNNIGEIFKNQGNYLEALKRYEEAIQIFESLGELSGKAMCLNNIGNIYFAQKNYPEALKRLEDALQVHEQKGDLNKKANALNNIGMIYSAQGNYPEALKRYEEALDIIEQLGNLLGKATVLNNIAGIHYAQKNYPEALRQLEEALQIDEQLGDVSGKAADLANIGMINKANGNYPEALKRIEEALEILISIGLGDSPNAKVFKDNIKMIKNKLS